MINKTDLNKVKEVAKTFLCFDIKIDKDIPVFVNHPFTDHMIVSDGERGLLELNCKENINIFIENMKKYIDLCDSYFKILLLITNRYRTAFFKYTLNYLDKYDLGDALSYIWVNTDYVNIDQNISKSSYVKLFKEADKNTLMEKDELDMFMNLPDEITVYRGVNDVTKHPIKALSWSIDYESAKWFADRFDNGTGKVYKTVVNKKDVLAYFTREQEVVVDFRKLKSNNIKLC